VARGRTRTAIAEKGLQIEGPGETVRVQARHVAEDAVEIGAVDLVLVAVKAWQIPAVAPILKPLVGPETRVLPLQNGVEAADQLADVLGREHVLNGMTKVIVRTLSPGHIEDLGFEPLIAAGELVGPPSTTRFSQWSLQPVVSDTESATCFG